jgi:hypothetical protein
MTENRLFRARALERISSPDQLDSLVAVTSPRRWIALSGLLLAVAAALVWSSISTVPTTLSGPGFLLPQGGLREVVAPIAGTVRSLELQPGTHVVAGDAVGSMSAPGGRSAVVRAPETGSVTELDSLVNAFAPAGKRLAIVEPVGWPLVVYSFVPTEVAADLTAGTEARVTPGAGIGSRFGYVKGTVESVSRFAVTAERLAFVLQDASLVAQVQQLGPVNEVVIALDQSATNASGFEWGRGAGPAEALSAGLPASVKFIIGAHHPINDVL